MTRESHLRYILSLADDRLMLSHRLMLWCGHAPTPEEDLALPNIALDLLGQAEMLYRHAAGLEGKGRDEDALAFTRKEHEYRNLLLCERPTEQDFAQTIVQLLYFSGFTILFCHKAAESRDETLAAIAMRAQKESDYHFRYAASWAVTLADGTDESRARMIQAVDSLYPYAAELFVADEERLALPEIAVDTSLLEDSWRHKMRQVSDEAGLDFVPEDGWQRLGRRLGGRSGKHGEEMGYILCQLQFMQRTHPGLEW